MDMYDCVPPESLMPLLLLGALRLEKSFKLLAFKLVLATLPPERSLAAMTNMLTGLETDRMLPPPMVMWLKQYVPPASVPVAAGRQRRVSCVSGIEAVRARPAGHVHVGLGGDAVGAEERRGSHQRRDDPLRSAHAATGYEVDLGIPVDRGVVRTRHFVVGVRGLDVVSIRRPAAEGAEAIGLGAQRRGAADARQRAARAAAAQLAVESTLRARGGHSRAPRDAGLDQAVGVIDARLGRAERLPPDHLLTAHLELRLRASRAGNAE